MELKISEKLIRSNKLTITEILLVIASRYGDIQGETIELQKREVLTKNSDGKLVLSPSWEQALDEILEGSSIKVGEEQWWLDFAKEFVDTFPSSKMPATGYYYRGSKMEIAKRLQKFFNTHTEYKPTDEMRAKVVDAAKRYNQEMDFRPKYRALAKYFISKEKTIVGEDGMGHVEEVSQLASYLENDNKQGPPIEGMDWMSTLKN